MSATFLAEIQVIARDVVAGTGSGPGVTNLWRAGLYNCAHHASPSPALPKLIGHQTLLARYLSEELPGALAQGGGRRLAGCSGSAPLAPRPPVLSVALLATLGWSGPLGTISGRSLTAGLPGAEGLSYEAATEVMACQTGTVKSRVSRARALLAERLEMGGGAG